MNILSVTPFFTPQTGGVATYLEDFRRHLSLRGHKVYVLRPGESHAITPCPENKDGCVYEFALRTLWYPNTPIRGMVAFFVFLLPTLWRLTMFVRKQNIEVITLEYPLPFMFYFLVVRFLTGVKLIVGLHGADILLLHVLPSHEQWVVRQIVRRADWVLAHSSSLMSQAINIVGQLHDNRSYLPYGVDCEILRGSADKNNERLSLPARPFILTVAKLYEWKGLDVLLQAIKTIVPRPEGYRFVIVGDGPEDQRLKQLTSSLNIHDLVLFMGEVQNSDVPTLFQHCEFFVLPSRSEPFGIVLLEAMTFGKALIATEVGGIPEFITNGANGILVRSDDSSALANEIKRLIEDYEFRSNIGKKGLSLVEKHYDYRNLISQYETLFQTVISAKP